MYDQKEKLWQDLKNVFYNVVPYFVDFATSIGIGLLVALVLGVPFAFFRDVPMDIVHFVFGLFGMCVALYRCCFRRGYHANSCTYSFSLKKAAQYTGICFAVQTLLIMLIGAHALYVTGPTYWITETLFPSAVRSVMGDHFWYEGYDWLLMFLADGLLYGPIMLYGEYVGSKERKKDYSLETQER